jgi:prepilin-type processing-associated H-X9-DG protein
MQPPTKQRAGFSRIELIVLIGIAVSSGALLLPAVQSAREAARRHQCMDHLRQLGIALHAYHDRNSVFPPAATWGSEGLTLARLDTHEDPTPIHVTRLNWIQMLLPDLDQESLARRFDQTVPVADERNRLARTTLAPFRACPSDPFNRPDNFYRMPLPDGTVAEFARGNYAINGGSEYVPASFGTLANPGPTHSKYRYNEETREFQFSGNGIAGINESLSLRDFRSGTSTLVAIEEIRAGLSPIDTRGCWALGQIGASITWGHGVIGDDGSPNATEKDAGPDDIRHGKQLYAALGREFIDGERMQACDHCDENTQATARSKHPGGVNVLMLDGAVRFVSDNVEPTLWHVMHSRDTPREVLAELSDEELGGAVGGGNPLPAPPPPVETVARDARASSDGAGEVVNSLGMRFVVIPAGEFTMGLPDAGYQGPYPPDAIPHRVRISRAYRLGRHEVTQRQYSAVVGSNPSGHAATGEFRERVGGADTSDWPVENVSWDDAVEFCRRLSERPEEMASGRRYRLPTEAEWEYACRAGRAGPIERPGWRDDDPTGEIAAKKTPKGVVLVPKPVGSYPANPFGVSDMCGNVYEWTSDFRRRDYYAQSPTDDPPGPATGYLHVIRGWHWVATGPACKVYVGNEPWVGSPFIGFRVVCEEASAE